MCATNVGKEISSLTMSICLDTLRNEYSAVKGNLNVPETFVIVKTNRHGERRY